MIESRRYRVPPRHRPSGPPERDRLSSGPPARDLVASPSLFGAPETLEAIARPRRGLLPLGDQGLRDRDRRRVLADRPGAFPRQPVRRSLRPDVCRRRRARGPDGRGRRLVGPGSRGARAARPLLVHVPALSERRRGRRRARGGREERRRDRGGDSRGSRPRREHRRRPDDAGSRQITWLVLAEGRERTLAGLAGSATDADPHGPQSRNRQVGSGSAAGAAGGDGRDGGGGRRHPGCLAVAAWPPDPASKAHQLRSGASCTRPRPRAAIAG